jgi:hypothetical protein
VLSLLDNVTVRGAGAGADNETVSGVAVAPIVRVLLAGTTTFPALTTVTAVVASAMNGVALAWITAEPSETDVTGTFTLVANAGKLTLAGTVATPGVAELRFTVNPDAGAGAERFRTTGWVPIPAMVTVGCANVTTAVVCTVPVLDV